MGGRQTHICNQPGFSCLTYTISSEETSQIVLLEAEGLQKFAQQMENQHNIYRILNRLYSCLW